MKSLAISLHGRVAGFLILLSAAACAGDGPPGTGPATEKRFPPLRVPPGFKATLFACDPLVEYPSAVADGPRPGSIFVAADYMTGLGLEIVRRDEIRLVEDLGGDGYADRATVYAQGFNSIQGLAQEDGTLFVMHAPFLSALRDVDGDNVADERLDLLSGLGLTPEENPTRLHCANGVVVGRDGWLYLALGDHGCDVPRPEGDRLVLQGGGILRCRRDGRDLHVFASGLRNIYDVALDDDLNVFVRDNENDGGDYMIRVAHTFFGADHGYPYLYAERPAEALPPLADLGRGSSAGGVCYSGEAFPPEYRGNLFFCEWGRAVMRYRPVRDGSTFAPLEQIEFATAAQEDRYGFKPTDIIVTRDGALIVSDWGDGQRPKRGRGRIYRIAAGTPAKPAPTTEMPKAGMEIRERLRVLSIRAKSEGVRAIPFLLDVVQTESEPRVQAAAVRALADLCDPILAEHRLDAGPGSPDVAAHLAALGRGKDPRVLLEVVIALGRLRWPDAPGWLRANLTDPDPALAHAAMQTLRRSGQWNSVLKLLDESAADAGGFRGVAVRALAERFEPEVVDGLIARLRVEPSPERRREYADLLTLVAHKPGPWTYWGYRPAPRPANTVAWERTEAIEQALDRVLADTDHALRLAVLRRMQREQVATKLGTLDSWLRDEREPDAVAVLLEVLPAHPADQTRNLLAVLIGDRTQTAVNRQSALSLWVAGLDDAGDERLVALAGSLEEGPVLAELLRRMGARHVRSAAPLLIDKLRASDPEVRTAAVEGVAALGDPDAGETVRLLLNDPEISVRRAAVVAVGQLQVRNAIAPLLELEEADPALQGARLEALGLLREPRVVPLASRALGARATQLAALRCLESLGGSAQLNEVVAVARTNPPTDVLHEVIRVLASWSRQEGLTPEQRGALDRAMSRVHGASGVLARWQVSGPVGESAIAPLIERSGTPGSALALESSAVAASGWQTQLGTGADFRVRPGGATARERSVDSSWLGCADLDLAEATPVQFLASSGGRLRVWLNGLQVHVRDDSRPFATDSDRFEATLGQGLSRVFVAVTPGADATEFHLRFRRKGSTAERERLMQLALTRPGSAERGRAIFLKLEKSQCLKCHRMRDQGASIGPDLSGIGGRFPRAYLIESVLEPSRTIAPSYETLAVALSDGRVLTGVRTAETATTLTLADPEGRPQVLAKAEIETTRPQTSSLMPDGLEKQFTAAEFVDLIAFLAAQK